MANNSTCNYDGYISSSEVPLSSKERTMCACELWYSFQGNIVRNHVLKNVETEWTDITSYIRQHSRITEEKLNSRNAII